MLKPMSFKLTPLFGAAVLAGWAIAQTPGPDASVAPATSIVGKVGKVDGLVTVSNGTAVSTVGPDAPVYDGSRFVTGSTGSLDLDFADGCAVQLGPNQTTTVDSAAPCGDRKSAVVALLPDTTITASAAIGLGGVALTPVTAGLGLVAAAALIDSTITTSPSATGGGGGTSPGGGGSNPGGGGGLPNPPPSGQ